MKLFPIDTGQSDNVKSVYSESVLQMFPEDKNLLAPFVQPSEVYAVKAAEANTATTYTALVPELKPEIYTILDTAYNAGVPWLNCKLIAAQAWHESGNFTSNVYKQNNNAFGMKMPSVRSKKYIAGPGTPAPSSEGGGFYARYESLKNSVLDVISLYQYNKVDWSKVATPADFAAWLKLKGYYGDTQANYQNSLINYSAKMSNILQPVTAPTSQKKKLYWWIGAAVVFVAVTIFLIFKPKKNGKRKRSRY